MEVHLPTLERYMNDRKLTKLTDFIGLSKVRHATNPTSF